MKKAAAEVLLPFFMLTHSRAIQHSPYGLLRRLIPSAQRRIYYPPLAWAVCASEGGRGMSGYWGIPKNEKAQTCLSMLRLFPHTHIFTHHTLYPPLSPSPPSGGPGGSVYHFRTPFCRGKAGCGRSSWSLFLSVSFLGLRVGLYDTFSRPSPAPLWLSIVSRISGRGTLVCPWWFCFVSDFLDGFITLRLSIHTHVTT